MDIWGISPFVQRCFANLNLSPPSRHRSMYGDYCDAVASIPKETTEAFVRAYRGRSALPEAAVSELRRIPVRGAPRVFLSSAQPCVTRVCVRSCLSDDHVCWGARGEHLARRTGELLAALPS